MSSALPRAVSAADVPDIDADAEGLDTAASTIRSSGRRISLVADQIAWNWSSAIPSALVSSGAVEGLYSAMTPPSVAAASLASDTDGAAAALSGFAEAVQTLRSRRDRIIEDVATFHSDALSAQNRADGDAEDGAAPAWDDDHRLAAKNSALAERIDALRRDWRTARQDCSDALGKLRNSDTKDALFPGRAPLSPTQYGYDFPGAASAFDRRISARQIDLLERLSTMSGDELDRWRAGHPAQYQGFIDLPPDPKAVDRWWRSLGDDPNALTAAQVALATGLPVLIGNLQGTFYSARDLANRTYVQEYRPSGKDTDLDKTIEKIKQQIALADGTGTVLQITTLDPRGVPRVAFSMGNLDTADNVTYLVPGIKSWTAGDDAVPQWMNSASALLNEQDRKDLHHTHAVVAWIGYDAPSVVTEPQRAQADKGGAYLAGEFDGLRATRGDDPTLNLVGHSYGTTVASVALQRTHVDRFVTLASAGLAADERSDLGVPEGEMYSTEARGDYIADIGRSWWSGSEHRTKPTAGFGTKLFDVSQDGDLAGSHSHDSNPGTLQDDGSWDSAGDGYLSPGSHSLDSVAQITTGRGDEIERTDYDG
ncbi:hypothetical protein FHW23_002072 [Curtobacterium pusillum]|uniref:DUF1023 domain-containing protein n=1 Tax=Curtobacterium pusillum TaxID=69373 RepID=A0AAW3T8U0_9MICO|nr:alpha/beta hydrolase [Curtobacterium pusillum]MBA8990807.1 hypothetical protein [Curtobacterium pusillum]